MVDVQMVTETSKDANGNRQAGRQVDTQDPILIQADALTNKKRLVISFFSFSKFLKL